ncbi:TMV resistance protein N-like [Rhodamnia argentea]|uniref:TMV resistance protein N-like n=1 Tax=Rhodamnia argentea TaxID=178133 RepID=A0ABM3H4L9_9MYRT|nr:TMV resistance protein N-like [Rhodamnia argentea]
MASSSKSTGPYAVFLSFRGTDVRNSFAGHLYNALVWNGIHTFRDNEELRKGQDISMVLKAIEESRIAISIFSEDYTSSWWCLEEVAKIMECKEQNDLIVLPVFYKVDPKEVRGGRASYARGLAKHESKHRKDSKEMERWKEALRHAGSLSGWTLNDGDDESKLIQDIVRNISTRLSQTPLHVADYPVGIESRVAEVKSMLNLESKDEVLMVGLWGQGGIGKTTLGRAIYNDISRQFDGSSFLANVRERSKDCMGLVTLQEQLLKDALLLQERLEVSDVARGISLIQQRLRHKRVLVILDDVDHLNQLRALAGKINWFGNGSRILVTTRDSHLPTPRLDWDHLYEVKALDNGEAHELLSKHAFPPHHKLKIREDLVDGVLDHAKGLPLALEVLGSFLCGRRQDEWESVLDGLSRIPTKDINDVLKISYDGLEANEKEIFLHIACFFKGWDFDHVKKVLDSCDLNAVIGLQILTERSLIRTEFGYIQVHDLIQLMGKDIVNQESVDLKRRSRLWLYEDVLDVTSHDMGDCDVKAIVLKPLVPVKISIGHDAFTKLRRLRLLILRNVSFQGPIPPDLNIYLRGGEMPEWVHPIKQDSISFLASKDLYDKFLGLALCFVVAKYDCPQFEILPHVNGKRRDGKKGDAYWCLDSDDIWLRYFTPYDLWGEVDFGHIDGNYVQFSLTVLTTYVKKWGFRTIAKSQEDDLKGVHLDPPSLYEFDHRLNISEAESSLMHEDTSSKADPWKDLPDRAKKLPRKLSANESSFNNEVGNDSTYPEAETSLSVNESSFANEVGHDSTFQEAEGSHMHQDCQISIEEQSEIGSKRKHTLILPQGWLHL